MKTKILSLTLVALISTTGLTACSTQAARINPGSLDTSAQSILHSGKIINIVQLSEKEAPKGKVVVGALTGALIGHVLTRNSSDSKQEVVSGVAGLIGGHVAREKYGKTIFRLTVALDDKSVKDVYVRGGHYALGSPVKLTLNRNSGEINSFKAI